RAWFRLGLRVDERLAGEPLALRVWHWGASEIYVDGKLIVSFGRITPEADEEYNPRGLFVPFVFAGGDTHTIAVRYSYKAASDLTGGRERWLARGGYIPGFSLAVAPGADAASRLENRARGERLNYVLVGVMAALTLIHLLLFVFHRRARGNLFYSFFVAGLAGSIWVTSLESTGHSDAVAIALLDLTRLTAQAVAVMSLSAFLYVEFAARVSRFFWFLLMLWLVAIALLAGQISPPFSFFLVVLFVTFVDCLRIALRALVERRAGAWIIAAGIGVLIICVANNVAAERKLTAFSVWAYKLSLNMSILSVPLAVSIYLARNFARTNRDLETKLVQVEDLSARELEHERREAELRVEHERTLAESERRAKELEEARQLQLSMLPAKLPELPHLDIAAYMKPATEVGGDYYDFHVGEDGTLTVAVGDATGHGLRAGTMVTAMKSLFNTHAQERDITHIFKQSSGALKRMNFRSLYMGMTMIKICGSELRVSAAGMPPVLIYRAAAGRVEEVSIKAMPLGSVASFPYKEEKFSLSFDDVIVLMSDGFAERFNAAGEMIDYAAANIVLAQVAAQTPQEIIDHFVQMGESWAGSHPQDDDVTFVVVKVKDG
ncbi:MAG TPA: SpoIIE family protein phosphatase, partial [Pyrinomonadaceae bacterium]|nr:SpoIIE family protein phosphatase [Pyrinomonadaceae bacterium]